MNRLIALLAILIMAFGVTVGAQAKSVDLEYKFTKGEVIKYRMGMDVSAKLPASLGGAPLPVSAKVMAITKQKVLDVMEDGSARIQVSLHDLKMTIPGMPERAMDNAPSQAVTMVMSKYGRVLSIDGLGQMMAGAGFPGADFGQMMGQMGAFGILPGRPVEVGEKWIQAAPLPFGGGQMQIDSELLAAALPIGSTTGSKLRQSFRGYLDLGEMVKGMSGGARMDATEQQAIASISGGADLKGWTVLYFSPTRGGLVKANSNIIMDLNMNLPEGAAASGVPAQFNMVIDMQVDIARIR